MSENSELAIGIDLGGTNLRAALVNHDGKILVKDKCKTPKEEGPEATVRAMAELVKNVRGEHVVKGIGIGSPGPLSREKRMIFQTANLPGFDRFPMGDLLEELSGLPVKIDNDAKCATYGEARFGAAQGKKNFILMTFGTGIGGGIFVDGGMVYGKSDGACEIGHMTLYPNGRQCQCSNRGCVEQYISASAFKRRAQEKCGEDLGGKEILDRVEAGEKWARELLEEFSKDVAMATASLVTVFNPELIVFGGGLFTSGGGPILEKTKEHLPNRGYKSLLDDITLTASSLEGNAGVLGAASLAWLE